MALKPFSRLVARLQEMTGGQPVVTTQPVSVTPLVPIVSHDQFSDWLSRLVRGVHQ